MDIDLQVPASRKRTADSGVQPLPPLTKQKTSSMESVELTLDDTALDSELLALLQADLVKEPLGPTHLKTILLHIVEQLPNHLNLSLSFKAIGALLSKHSELEPLLRSAFHDKQFHKIRRLKILQIKPSWKKPPPTLDSRTDEMNVTHLAWEAQYVGSSAVLLRECIMDMNYERQDEAYRNFTTIIQSSGTGKSRTVDEMARLVFTLPFNLRNPIEDTGYPRPDVNMRNFFHPETCGKRKENHDKLKMRYLLFFHRLFESTQRSIKDCEKQSTHEEFAGKWRESLRDQNSMKRKSLYDEAITTVPGDIHDMKDAIKLAQSSVQELLMTIAEKSSDSVRYECQLGSPPVFPRHRGPVRIFLYFDEAHDLTEDLVDHTEINKQTSTEPEASALVQRSAYMALCSALNEFEPFDLFAIFLSTNPSLSKFAPSKAVFWSARSRDAPHHLQPPFVELPFDVWKERYILTENKHMLADVCEVEHMVKFGRPLFWTRWEIRNREVNQAMIQFAVVKLRGASNPESADANGDLAALSVRLLLEFEPQREAATSTENRLVAGHMRIAYSVPAHCEYMRSGTPSEPILAEAAAAIMKDMNSIPKRLLQFVDNGLISKGERGELVARLLLTLAHDAAVNKLFPQSKLSSRPIPLVDFLAALFRPDLMKTILNSQAQNVSGGPTLGEAFKDAYVHFTHFAKASNDEIMRDEYMWFAMARGMAWQCYDQQNLTDMLIPILLWNAPLGRFVMSVLAIQIKNRKFQRMVRVDLQAMERPFFTPSNTGDEKEDYKFNTRPYLTLTMDVGVQPRNATKAGLEKISAKPSSDSAPKRERAPAMTTTTPSKLTIGKPQTTNMELRSQSKPKHPRYAIRATGCSPTVYGVIAEGERDTYASLLASRDLLQEHPRQKQKFKDAILCMKPFWNASVASLDFINMVHSEATNAVPDSDELDGWVTAGDEAAEDDSVCDELF